MKKNIVLIPILSFFLILSLNAQIVINEIMYNPPESGDDLHEFIELYNAGNDTVDMKDYSFTDGIKMTFESYFFAPGTYLVVAKDSATINDFGIDAILWTSGGLKNSGEAIVLADNNGITVDSVKYDDGGDWTSKPDGDGPSLELCSFSKDNTKPENWKASVHPTGLTVNGKEYLCTPGAPNSVECDTVPPQDSEVKLVITEIMYNDPGDPDSLEFIEIYNAGNDTVFLNNFQLITKTINFEFPDKYIKPHKLLTLCKDPVVFQKYFNVFAISWESGGLSNKEDTLVLLNNLGDTIDIVEYKDSGNWSQLADGNGYSLSLCNPLSDNNIGSNWQASPVFAGFDYNGLEMHANPGSFNYCSYDIEYLHKKDSTGMIINPNLFSYIEGTVYGINYNKKGLQFVLSGANNRGIWIYSNSKDFGYTVKEGDKVALWGKLDQYYGLEQIKPDSVVFLEGDTLLYDPEIVTKMDESTEGQLITIKNVHLINYLKWTNTGTGFNVDVTNDTDTFAIRIDADTDIFGKPAPIGTFNITGLGGQYDKVKPLFDGYQLLPRYISDIDPYEAEAYPFKTIGEVTGTDDEGVGTSLGQLCELRGVVYGVNLRPNGLQFTIIDQLKNGIGVFSSSENFGYEVTEGDFISIKGKISQYNGLLQIIPDTLNLISQDESLYPPYIVTTLDENTESQLITIKNCKLKNISDWKGDGSSFNVTFTNGTDDFKMRIDNDVDLSTSAAPDYSFNLTGIGSQYDPSKPYTEGYQIMPRYASDIEKLTNIIEFEDNDIQVFPNPVSEFVSINTNGKKFHKIIVFSSTGIKEIEIPFKSKINTNRLLPGIYNLMLIGEREIVVKKLLKI